MHGYYLRMGNSASNNSIKLLWSGGWDSTFRLLQLLLIEKKFVKPYYLIDPNRKSLNYEIRTMREIKNRLFQKFPETQKLLLPTYMCEVNDIKENPDITKHYQIVKKKYSFGEQYDWLARFAVEHELNEIEISWEGREMTTKRKAVLPLVHPSSDIYTDLDPSINEIFKYYRYPIFYTLRTEMISIAEQNDFFDLLDLSWSCHSPSRWGRPCGRCTPCVTVMETGLSYRFSFVTKIKYYFFKPLLNTKKKSPRIYRFLKKVKNFFLRD